MFKKFFKNPTYPDSHTIDLRYINARDYCNSRDFGIGDKIFSSAILIFTALGVGFLISLMIPSAEASEDIKTSIREERLEICQEAYLESGIGKKFIHKQIPAVRCATYMSLIYAYESGFGTSRMCMEDNNCFGMKGNGVDTPSGFLVFNTEREGREYFAKKYFMWHYKKDIETFIYSWSMTDRDSYIFFMRSRYHELYQELEKQYLF